MTAVRNTGIMATLSDARATEAFVTLLRDAGMDAVRINSAHVSPEMFCKMVKIVRSVDPGIRILMDTKGPEVRTTDAPEPMMLDVGDKVEIVSAVGGEPCSGSRIYTAVAGLDRCVSPGTVVLIDDGLIAVEVGNITDGVIHGRVVRGGTLGSRKTIAFDRGELPPLPPVSRRDRLMLEAARDMGIDMVAHSFVRSREDVEAVRSVLDDSGIVLFAKIECRSAVANMVDIIDAADGVLVARGDLGTAYALSEIPVLQHEIMRRCHAAAKPTIVSTQILQSMLVSPQPTRAEMSDVALAVMEGADWLLLCGETAQGSYPAECVGVMRRTVESVEAKGLRDCMFYKN